MQATETPSRSRPSARIALLVGLVVALFGTQLVGLANLDARLTSTTPDAFLLDASLKWVVVGVLLAIVVYWERRTLASIGLDRPSARQVAVGVAAGVGGLVAGLLATGVAVAALGLEQPETLSVVASLSLPVKLAVVATAVVAEELLWRGYPIERLTELTGRVWIGAAVSGLVFLAVHYPAWGLVGAIPQAVFTLVLVGVYVWSRNVVVSMVTHGVINTVMILVLPAVL